MQNRRCEHLRNAMLVTEEFKVAVVRRQQSKWRLTELADEIGKDGIDVIALGLRIEKRAQLLELVRIAARLVVQLVEIVAQVIELPDIIVDWAELEHRPRLWIVRNHRHPPICPDAAVAVHLEILRTFSSRHFGMVEGVTHADA